MDDNQPQAAPLPKGMSFSLGVLSYIAYPFLLAGLIGGMLMVLGTTTVDSVSEYGRLFPYLAAVVLCFVIGRGLLLATEFIRKNHTELITENLVLKYTLLVMREAFFMIGFVHCCGFAIQILFAFLGLRLEFLTICLVLLLPGLIAGYLCHQISLHPLLATSVPE